MSRSSQLQRRGVGGKPHCVGKQVAADFAQEVALEAAGVLLRLAGALPVVGPAVQALAGSFESVYNAVQQVKVNRNAAKEFGARVQRVNELLVDRELGLLQVSEQMEREGQSDLLQRHLNGIQAQLVEACQVLEEMSRTGFLLSMLHGRSVVNNLQDVDQELARVVKELFEVTNVASLSIQRQTFQQVQDIRETIEQLGGIDTIRKDPAQLASALDASPEDLAIELVQRAFEQFQQNLESELHQITEQQESSLHKWEQRGVASALVEIPYTDVHVDRAKVLGADTRPELEEKRKCTHEELAKAKQAEMKALQEQQCLKQEALASQECLEDVSLEVESKADEDAASQLVSSSSVGTGSPELDRQGLVAFFHATGGPNWKQPWDLDRPVESWRGVSIDPDSKRLIKLDLQDNRVTGALPPEVGHWTSVRELFLSSNQLQSLPAEVQHWTSMTTLSLYRNQLQSLPAEVQHWTSMTRLDLNNNQLQSLPAEVRHWSSITKLSLSNNQLQSLPAEVQHWTSMTRLDLNNNQLQSLPAEVQHWTSMKTLYLNNNQLQSLPAEVQHWSSMATLSLYHNQLQSLPAEVQHWTSMTALDLDHNQLQSLPAEVQHWTSMKRLDLNNNQLQSLPAEVQHWTSMTTLFLYHNQLRSLPAEVRHWTSMTRLDLNNNQLQSLPAEVRHWTSMTRLDLYHNQLQSLPAEVQHWSSMTRLDLDHNQLQSLPTEVQHWSSMTRLFLDHNQLQSLPHVLRTLEGRRLNIEFADNPVAGYFFKYR